MNSNNKTKKNAKQIICIILVTLLSFILGCCVSSSHIFTNAITNTIAKNSKYEYTELENQRANTVYNLLSQSFNVFGDYSKLNKYYKNRIAKENFEYMCFRNCSRDGNGNPLHNFEYGEIGIDGYENFNWTYPTAEERDGYVLVTYEYNYESKKMKESVYLYPYDTSGGTTVFVKVVKKDGKLCVEDVFEPISSNTKFFPKWAQ